MIYSWDWSVLFTYWEAFLNGALNTIWISLTSILLGTFLGIIILGAHLFIQNRLFNRLLSSVTQILLAIPLLVLMVWIYYCVPILFDLNLGTLTTCILAMTINMAPFISETLRSGIESIPKGYTEAGLSLGLSKKVIMAKILLPQAFREMLPAILTQYISLLKLSSLASVISVNEILHSANNIIAESFRPLEVFTIIALIYISIVLPLSTLAKFFEVNNMKPKKDLTT